MVILHISNVQRPQWDHSTTNQTLHRWRSYRFLHPLSLLPLGNFSSLIHSPLLRYPIPPIHRGLGHLPWHGDTCHRPVTRVMTRTVTYHGHFFFERKKLWFKNKKRDMSFFVNETCVIYLKLVCCTTTNNMFRFHRFETERRYPVRETVVVPT